MAVQVGATAVLSREAGQAVTDFWEKPLLARIAAGDHAALGELHDRLGGPVRRRVQRVTGDVLATELITIGVFATVWSRPQQFAANGLSWSLLHLAGRRAALWTADAAEALTG